MVPRLLYVNQNNNEIAEFKMAESLSNFKRLKITGQYLNLDFVVFVRFSLCSVPKEKLVYSERSRLCQTIQI